MKLQFLWRFFLKSFQVHDRQAVPDSLESWRMLELTVKITICAIMQSGK